MNTADKWLLCLLLLGLTILMGCGELAVKESPTELVSPRFSLKEIVGFVAGFGTTFAAMPDLIALFRRKSSQGMHPRMAAITGIFQMVWIYYGLLIVSRPVVLWNIVAVAVNFTTVGAYLHYSRKERKSRMAGGGTGSSQ
jgi:uncharacterized protein with PQ loop repeat